MNPWSPTSPNHLLGVRAGQACDPQLTDLTRVEIGGPTQARDKFRNSSQLRHVAAVYGIIAVKAF